MTRGQKMKSLEEEVSRIDAEIERLKARRQAFLDAMAIVSGVTPTEPQPPAPARKRAANVKPLILEIMAHALDKGATSAEVDELVRQKVPNVAKDTVGSVLSRLKGDGALVHNGERYYDKRFAPPKAEPLPFERVGFVRRN
jgi:hypothetical protein